MMQFAALLLAASLFGGMLLYSFGFAPLVFGTLPAPDAGRLLRAAFPRYYLFVAVTAGVAGALLLRADARSGGLSLAIAAVALYARQVLMPQINRARDAQLAGDARAARRFGYLHGFSVVLNLGQLVGAAYVLYRFL
jgi:hypothetical protein